MRRGTKLTRAQKVWLSKNTRLKPENWLVVEDNSKALVLLTQKG